MGNLMRAIARVLQAMRSTAWTWVKVGGRWIMKLNPLAGGAAATDLGPSADVQAEVADVMTDMSAFRADEETFGVKRLARLMSVGIDPTAEQLEGIMDRELDWLRVLDQSMLAKIAAGDHSQIRAHMRGTAPIKGVVPYDRAAVADMKCAQAVPAPSRGEQRTLREVLEAQGLSL